jgi:tRNA pseudouridine38-40 synthase
VTTHYHFNLQSGMLPSAYWFNTLAESVLFQNDLWGLAAQADGACATCGGANRSLFARTYFFANYLATCRYTVAKSSSVTEAPQSAPVLQTWKLTLAYDGTGFRGWQMQPGERTVQGELQAALGRVCGESPLPQGSGRTDAGVHALGQVASFALAAPIPAENLQRALNRTLPPAIRILEAKIVPSTFHARHSAVAKTYEYRVYRGAICPPFLAPHVYACSWPMDLVALQKSARVFEGKHDFLSFAATDPELVKLGVDEDAEPEERPLPRPGFQLEPPMAATVKTVFSSTWEAQPSPEGELLVYRVRGSGFLHHMVRNLVGTMLDVGRGRTGVDEIPGILAARSRAAAGPTAPAQGLFLCSVEYGEGGVN